MPKKSPNPSQDRQGEIRRLEGELGRLWNLYKQGQIDEEQFVRRRRELADQVRREKYAEYLSHNEAQRAGKYAKSLSEAQDVILNLTDRQRTEYGIKLIKKIEKLAPKDKRRRNERKTLYTDTLYLACLDNYDFTLDDILSSNLGDLLSRLKDLAFADEQTSDYDEGILYHISMYLPYKRWHEKHWDDVLRKRDETREFYKKKKKGIRPRREPESLSIILEPVGDSYHHKIPGPSTGRPTNKPGNDLVVGLYKWLSRKENPPKDICDRIKKLLDAFCGVDTGKDNIERILGSYSN